MTFLPGSEFRDIKLDGSPLDIDLSNDGKYLAVAIERGKPCVRVFTTKDGKCVGEFGEGAATAWGVAFVEGGKSLCYLTWNEDQQATLWKVELPSGKPKKLKSLATESRCKFLERDAEGTLVAVGGHALLVIDVGTGKQSLRVGCNIKGAEGVAHFADPKRIWVSGSESARLVLYDIADGKQLNNLEAPASFCMQVTGSPDGRWLVGVGGGGHGVTLYDLKGDKKIAADAGGDLEINDDLEVGGCFAFSHDSKLVLYPNPSVISLTLPDLKVQVSDESIASAVDTAMRAATALEAPLVALAYDRDKKVVLIPTKGKK
jgi:WD40 repeat protein